MKKGLWVVFLLLTIGLSDVLGQAYYFWTNGDGDNLWSNGDNWLDQSYNPGVVPSTNDVAVFLDDATNANCIIDVNIGNLSELIIGGNEFGTYSGTVSLNSNGVIAANLTTLGSGQLDLNDGLFNAPDLNIEGGTFNKGTQLLTATNFQLTSGLFNASAGNIRILNTFSITGGVFNSTPNELEIRGDLLISGGTFNANNGLVLLNENNLEITSDQDFYNLTLQNVAATALTFTINGEITVNNNLIIQNGTFGTAMRSIFINDGTINLHGNLSLIGARPQTFTGGGTGSIRFVNTSLAQSISGVNSPFEGKAYLPTVEVDKGSQVLTATNGLNIAGDLIITSGNFESTGTVIFPSNSSILGNGQATFNNLTVTSDLILDHNNDLIINGLLTNNGSVEASSGTVVFESGSSLSGDFPGFHNLENNTSLNAPDVLSISGSLTNNGTITSTIGTLLMQGSGTRNISGSGVVSVNNLFVEGGDVNINGEVEVYEELEVASSTTLDADGSGGGVLTLKSTSSTNSANLAPLLGGASLSGNVSVERFIPGGRAWVLMGSPVNSFAIADLQNSGIPVNGSFTGASAVNGNSVASMYIYNETLGGGINARWQAYPTSSNAETISRGQGINLFRFSTSSDEIFTARGELLNSNFETSLSLTESDNSDDDGWHIIANPFAAATEWSDWDKTSIAANTAYIWDSKADGGNGAYIVLNGSGLIAQGQAFFVKAGSGASLNAGQNSIVSNNTNTPFYRQNESQFLDELIISMDNGQYVDESRLVINTHATDEYDFDYDVLRLVNGGITLSTVSDEGKPLKVNHISPLSYTSTCGKSVFLNIEKTKINDTYTLVFDKTNWASATMIIDHYLGESYELNTALEISFTVNEDAASKGSERFEIQILPEEPVLLANQLVYDNTICYNDSTIILIENSNTAFNYQLVYEDSIWVESYGNGGDLEFHISTDQLADENLFKVKMVAESCGIESVQEIGIQRSEAINKGIAQNTYALCANDASVNVELSTEADVVYEITINESKIIEINGTGNEVYFEIENEELSNGVNEIAVKARRSGCDWIVLDNPIEINKKEKINTNIDFSHSQVCRSGIFTIDLTGTQTGAHYSLYFEGVKLHEVVATGSTLSMELESDHFEPGTLSFDMEIGKDGCSSGLLENVISLAYNEFIVNKPDDVEICRGETVSFTLNASDAIRSVLWYDSNQNLIEEVTDNKFTLTEVTETSVLYVRAIAENGCESDLVAVAVSVTQLEEVILKFENDYLKTNTQADSYQWYKDGVAIEGANASGLPVTSSGSYTLMVSTNNCSVVSDAFEINILDTNRSISNDITLFPNPTVNQFTITSKNHNNGSLNVYDSGGRIIVNQENIDLRSYSVNSASWKAGIYMVVISTNETIYRYKIVKK